MKNQDRYLSGRFKPTTFVCSCGIRSQGALSRDMHAAGHMVIRPAWFKRAIAKQRGSE